EAPEEECAHGAEDDAAAGGGRRAREGGEVPGGGAARGGPRLHPAVRGQLPVAGERRRGLSAPPGGRGNGGGGGAGAGGGPAGGLILREDVPAVFKTNYATALLGADNLPGCLRVLEEIRDEEDAAVGRLRAAIGRWQNGRTFWQKLAGFLGGRQGGPPALDF